MTLLAPSMSDATAVLICINHCHRRRDGRGRWRAEETLRQALHILDGSDRAAEAAAAAVARIGGWLSTVGIQPAAPTATP